MMAKAYKAQVDVQMDSVKAKGPSTRASSDRDGGAGFHWAERGGRGLGQKLSGTKRRDAPHMDSALTRNQLKCPRHMHRHVTIQNAPDRGALQTRQPARPGSLSLNN